MLNTLLIAIASANASLLHTLYNITIYYPQFNTLIYIVAERIDIYIVFAGVLFILLHRHRDRLNKPALISRVSFTEGLYTLMGIGLAWIISFAMKISFGAGRPFVQFTEILPLFVYGGYDSFPSGHATLFAAMGVAIYLHHKTVGAIFIFFAFIIAFARVVAGVHFPFDVLVGWAIGSVVSYASYRYLKHRGV